MSALHCQHALSCLPCRACPVVPVLSPQCLPCGRVKPQFNSVPPPPPSPRPWARMRRRSPAARAGTARRRSASSSATRRARPAGPARSVSRGGMPRLTRTGPPGGAGTPGPCGRDEARADSDARGARRIFGGAASASSASWTRCTHCREREGRGVEGLWGLDRESGLGLNARKHSGFLGSRARRHSGQAEPLRRVTARASRREPQGATP